MSLQAKPREGPDVDDCLQRHKRSKSPAVSAAAHGHVACLRALCSADVAAVHSRDLQGHTPLFEAARNDHVDCVQLLLDLGADDEGSSNDEHETALTAAAGSGHVECVRLLMEKGVQHQHHALREAVARDKLECARLLLEQGADPNAVLAVRPFGTRRLVRRPLYYAVLREAQLRLLIEFGADVNAVCDVDKQRTPLHEATRRASVDCVQILLRHGANIDAVDNEGQTPLHDAALDCSDDKVKAILGCGCHSDTRTIRGETAFADAAYGGATRIPFDDDDGKRDQVVLRILHRLGVDDAT